MEIRDRVRAAGTGALLCVGLFGALPACHSSSDEIVTARVPRTPVAREQPLDPMRREQVPPTLRKPRGTLPDECARRRRELAAAVGGPSVIWVGSAPSSELSRFFQSDDFYYLTGVETADVALALHVGADGALVDEVLFLQPYDAHYEVWNGKRPNPGPEAEAAIGIRKTAPIGTEAEVLASWKAPKLYAIGQPPATLPAGMALDPLVDDREEATPLSSASLRAAIDALRLTKSDYEIDCLANAITITTWSMGEALKAITPGAYEYEPQGLLEGNFTRLGSERTAFHSIVGSGPNSCALHYEKNDREMQAGELLVMDVGARWKYYSADVTRTFPVSGRFTPRQREVYQTVLDAQTAAFEAAQPGVTMRELDAVARKLITERGFGPDHKYFKHGLGHWIGLYVHDVGAYGPILPGMTFTIEPGIYIDEENLGVRIEDDYLMTETGAIKLSDGIPSAPDAIEALMAGH